MDAEQQREHILRIPTLLITIKTTMMDGSMEEESVTVLRKNTS